MFDGEMPAEHGSVRNACVNELAESKGLYRCIHIFGPTRAPTRTHALVRRIVLLAQPAESNREDVVVRWWLRKQVQIGVEGKILLS